MHIEGASSLRKNITNFGIGSSQRICASIASSTVFNEVSSKDGGRCLGPESSVPSRSGEKGLGTETCVLGWVEEEI